MSPRPLIPLAFLAFLAFATGCAGPRAGTGSDPARPAPVFFPVHGEVVRVNPEAGYVLLAASSVLPSPGDTLTVFRGDQPSATVRVGTQAAGKTFAADLLNGSPAVGDRFWGTQR